MDVSLSRPCSLTAECLATSSSPPTTLGQLSLDLVFMAYHSVEGSREATWRRCPRAHWRRCVQRSPCRPWWPGARITGRLHRLVAGGSLASRAARPTARAAALGRLATPTHCRARIATACPVAWRPMRYEDINNLS